MRVRYDFVDPAILATVSLCFISFRSLTDSFDNISSISTEYEFRPLAPDAAVIVDNIWYSRAKGSLEFIKRLIKYNYNIGIYLKSSGELIGWCIR